MTRWLGKCIHCIADRFANRKYSVFAPTGLPHAAAKCGHAPNGARYCTYYYSAQSYDTQEMHDAAHQYNAEPRLASPKLSPKSMSRCIAFSPSPARLALASSSADGCDAESCPRIVMAVCTSVESFIHGSPDKTFFEDSDVHSNCY